MKLLALTINGTPILAPSGVLTGGTLSLNNILQFLSETAFFVAILIGVGMVIWGGIKWVMSEGDKQKIEATKAHLQYAIIGFSIIAFSFLIVNIIGYFFNVKLMGP